MENFEINCLQPPNKLFAAAKKEIISCLHAK